MVSPIERCRICGNKELVLVIDLGDQFLTGVFPDTPKPSSITSGPLQLVKCQGSEEVCGLVQLRHSYQASEMYGAGYGYRSGLNQTMVKHLQSKVKKIEKLILLSEEDVVIDIGSNDGTTLREFKIGPQLIGIDPAASKFKTFYPENCSIVSDFFSRRVALVATSGKLAKVITSFAMIYDLEDPVTFAKEIASVLSSDGIWVFEQSYMPFMVERLAYDTICHEHIEYYGLRQIQWILKAADLKIIDIEFNDINGGSFSVTATHTSSNYESDHKMIEQILDKEQKDGYMEMDVYHHFANRVRTSRDEMINVVSKLLSDGKRIIGLGASTKGNVLLQFCNFDSTSIEAIGDINPDKHGCFTPGTWIPIISEKKALALEPDYFLVLPWHFKSFFLTSDLFLGRRLIFPLPRFEIISR